MEHFFGIFTLKSCKLEKLVIWKISIVSKIGVCTKMKVLVAQSHPTLCEPMNCSLPPLTPRILCPWVSPSKNTRVGCHSLLQGIFPNQGLSPGLLHCKQILYQLSHRTHVPKLWLLLWLWKFEILLSKVIYFLQVHDHYILLYFFLCLIGFATSQCSKQLIPPILFTVSWSCSSCLFSNLF